MSWLGRLSARRRYFLLGAGVFVADQLTKVAADRWLHGRGPLEVIPGCFNLVYSRNRGGLFGFFSTLEDPWRSILLLAVPVAAMAMIAVFLLKADEEDRATHWGLGFVLGGALGNLVDRVLRGEVVDFLDVYASWPPLRDWLIETFGTAHWPTFNVADSAIVAGACLLVFDAFRPRSRAAQPTPTATSDR